MRIAQITPGVIQIPPNGWGAVEKIIWEYTKVLKSLGHHVEIIYTDEVKSREWDVVHVHMANLALILRDRGIPYVFSHHDHHAHYLGKDSEVYKMNLEAIKGSTLSFVHAKYLVEYFGSQPQLRYLGHGANINEYEFRDRSIDLLKNKPSLIMMANNGIIGNPHFDRKGFLPGIESAMNLDLPITIICPSINNREFFRINSKYSNYEKLNVIYDLNYSDTLAELNKHHIFLNLGTIEAGHPNLTITESISMGIPVIGPIESDIPGMERIRCKGDSVDSIDVSSGIKKIMDSYSTYVLACKSHRGLISWEVVVSRMLMDYTSFFRIQQKDLILNDYKHFPKNHLEKKKGGYYYNFKRNPHFYRTTYPRHSYSSVTFRDSRTKSVKGVIEFLKDGRSWMNVNDSSSEYIDWEIIIKDGSKIIDTIKMDLKDQHVLIEEGKYKSEIINDKINRFVKDTGCIPTLTKSLSYYCGSGIESFTISEKYSESEFYRIVNTDQISDYFKPKTIINQNILIVLKTKSLGDSIAFVPYANEYAKRNGVICDLVCGFDFLFESIYDNVNIIPMPDNLTRYTDVIYCDYIYELDLQLGYAAELEMYDIGKIRPIINGSNNHRPIKKKYVCFSMHSTAQSKHWNNNSSWENLCSLLSKRGLIPVCIDRYSSFGSKDNWNPVPKNCKDCTGMILEDMINWIEHCEFFIGLSSGLSWVAHALGKKVVMISGVTNKTNEFDEDCIRIHRNDVCNSCFNYPEKYPFNPGDWMWCPNYKGTSRAFECTKKISAKQVIDNIDSRGWIK